MRGECRLFDIDDCQRAPFVRNFYTRYFYKQTEYRDRQTEYMQTEYRDMQTEYRDMQTEYRKYTQEGDYTRFLNMQTEYRDLLMEYWEYMQKGTIRRAPTPMIHANIYRDDAAILTIDSLWAGGGRSWAAMRRMT
jgi:hypothetical protein